MIALLAPFLILAVDPPPIETLPARGAPQTGTPAPSVFISPSGEPFRAPAGQPYPLPVWFAKADADHDGAVSPEEFEADAKAFFDRLDADHDGMVDGFEIADYEGKIAPEIQPRLGGAGEAMAAPAKGAAIFNLLLDPEPVASADADLDGKVSLKEALAAAGRRFKRLDSDHNGRLTLQELPQTPAEALKRRE